MMDSEDKITTLILHKPVKVPLCCRKGPTLENEEDISLEEIFRTYATDCKQEKPSLKHMISLSQSDKWMKESGLLDDHHITTTDTGVEFSKFKLAQLSYSEWLKYLENISLQKKYNFEDMKKKLRSCNEIVHRSKIKEEKIQVFSTDEQVTRLKDEMVAILKL